MCYYNGQKVTKAELIRLKSLEKLVVKYNFLNRDLISGFDYGNIGVLKPIPEKEDFEIVQMEWGFIPHYISNRKELQHLRQGGTNPKTGKYDPPFLTLNAVGEELLQKITYKKAARDSRCLILSDGFYEWRHIYPISKKTGKPLKTAEKFPYFITIPGKDYFYMAGIYNSWTDKDTGETVESCSIVTTTAVGHELMEEVHNSKKRMPTILNENLAFEWMFGKLDDTRLIEIASTQYPSREMTAWSIAKDFRESINPRDEYHYPELPPLKQSPQKGQMELF